MVQEPVSADTPSFLRRNSSSKLQYVFIAVDLLYILKLKTIPIKLEKGHRPRQAQGCLHNREALKEQFSHLQHSSVYALCLQWSIPLSSPHLLQTLQQLANIHKAQNRAYQIIRNSPTKDFCSPLLRICGIVAQEFTIVNCEGIRCCQLIYSWIYLLG